MPVAKAPVLNDSLTTTPTHVLSLPSPLALPATSASPLSAWSGASRASAIAFIDASVPDYQTLVAGMAPGTEVHLLDSSQDAVTQITNTLLRRHNISSLHIVSHGEAGGLDFGSSVLNLSDLPQYAAQLQSWSNALTNDADLLLYGCNVAQGELGKAFTSILSQLTGADVAASDDLTGSANQGGNWTLEYQTGEIEASDVFQTSVQQGYHHVLATFTVTNTSDSGAGSLRQAITDANAAAGADTITFTGSTFTDATPDTISLTSGLTITGDTTITGTGANLLTVTNSTGGTIVTINGGATLNLSQLNISSSGNDGVVNNGTASLDQLTFTNNGGENESVYNNGTIARVTNSTFIDNAGNYGILNSGTIALISNNTFSGHYVGINTSGTITTIVNNTIAGGGRGISNSGTITNLYNNLLVGNGDNTLPTATNSGNNLTGTFAALNVDSTLRNNGGTTQTYALLTGSTAANAGDNTKLPQDTLDQDGDGNTTEAIPFDQRGTGFNRVFGGTVDIGAYEFGSIPNAAPVVTVSGSPLSYTENDPATLLDSTATVTDTDSANFDTGTLTVNYSANGTVDDRLAIRNQGTSTGQIGFSGSTVTYGGTTIGTFTGGTGTTALVITFNASATPAAVTALLQNLTYANVSEAPSTAARTVQFVVTDGDGGTSTAATKTINVTAVDDTQFFVTNTNDSGTGSLRQAILDANADPGAETITFIGSTFTDATPDTITLTSGLTLTEDVTITGTGANLLTVAGAGTSNFDSFTVNAGVTASFDGLTISNSQAGINNLGTIARVTNSTFSGNNVGLRNLGTIARVTNSTFSGNDIGIANQSPPSNSTIALISNNTFSGNRVGITNFIPSGSTFTAFITTIVNNTIAGSTGSAISNGSTITNFYNNLLVGNGDNTFDGTVTNQGNNLAGTFAALGVDSALQANGGSTLTHALLTGSTAANAGDNTKLPQDTLDADNDGNTTEAIPFDQRGTGFNRVIGGIVDIGAYESTIIPNAAPIVTVSGTALSYTENDPATLIDSTATVADTDSANFDTGTLTVSVGAGGTATDRLTILPNGTVTLDGRRILVSGTEIGTYRGGNGTNSLVISLNASATAATTQALVRAIGYSSVSDALPLNATNRTVSVTLTDGDGGTSTAATKTIGVTGSNDAAIVGSTQLLYDGSLNTPPQSQGWTFPPIGGTVSAANGTTNFSTTSNDTIRNGFTRTVTSGLNAAAGYTLSFTAQVVSSTPNGAADKDGDGNPDRAGFNLIVISSDTTKAIELSFLTNEIFAQEDGTSQVDPSQQAVAGTPSTYTNTLFTRGEAATFTTTSLINYDLTVSGSLYTLYANGTAILSGRLRNYTAFSGSPDPYEVPNQIFFGDDTTSANGEINLSRVALTTNSIANQTINEDGSANVAIGLFDPDGTVPTVSGVTSGNTTLLPNANIATSGSGSSRTLTLTPAANQFGTATVTLNYNDGTASTRAFDLVVNAVNDQPSVTLGSNQTVTAGSTAQTRTNWATFNPGAANEASQTATYTITNNTNPALFAVVPAIDAAGNLTYTPVSTLATATTATISVQVQDSGGTTNGGIDTSTVQTFTITVKPQPTIVITPVGNNEGNSGTTPYTFTVNLSDTSTQTVSVNYTTADGTATIADGDYTTASGTLTFAPGETSKTITVTVNGDTKYETNETFAVNLASAVNGAIASGSNTVNGTIGNDDNVPTVNITPTVTHAEGNSGTTPYVFTVSLSNASYQAIGINYTTSDITATTADGDYTAASGILTFAPGETSKTITVNANGDTKFEADQTFRVSLTGPANGSGAVSPGNTAGTGTITNDDSRPTLSSNSVSNPEGRSSTTPFTFTVSLSNTSDETVTVNYATANGTATTADNDYTAASGTLTFNPADTSQTLTVNAIGDKRREADETFQVTLTTPTNGTIASNGGTGTGTIANDDVVTFVWRNATTNTPASGSGENSLWQLNGFSYQTFNYLPSVTDLNWQIVGTADFNSDGTQDLLWRHRVNGENIIWLLNGTTVQSTYALPTVNDANWQIVGTGDFNGDTKADILWRNRANGQDIIWQVNGTTLQSTVSLPTVADANWQIVGTADFNHDGTADMLWRNKVNGDNILWQMNNFSRQSLYTLPSVADANWQIVGTADFNNDGSADILWRNKGNGQNILWQTNNFSRQSVYTLPTVNDANWQIQGTADFDGDGSPDLVWRNQQNGQDIIWQLTGFTYAQSYQLPTVAAPWHNRVLESTLSQAIGN